jgi:hypothetical protein
MLRRFEYEASNGESQRASGSSGQSAFGGGILSVVYYTFAQVFWLYHVIGQSGLCKINGRYTSINVIQRFVFPPSIPHFVYI